ncbi:MAG: hypothetical protein ABI557_16345 [Aureliella sp.]
MNWLLRKLWDSITPPLTVVILDRLWMGGYDHLRKGLQSNQTTVANANSAGYAEQLMHGAYVERPYGLPLKSIGIQ